MSRESGKICRICIDKCNDSKSLYDESGRTNELYDLICNYLHPTTLNLLEARHLTVMCMQCWQHLWDYDKFRESIQKAQLKLKEGESDVVVQLQTNVSIKEEIKEPGNDKNDLSQPKLEIIDIGEEEDSDCSSDEAEVSWENNQHSVSSDLLDKDNGYGRNKRQYQKINDILAMVMPIIKCPLCSDTFFKLSPLESHFSEKHPNEEFHILCCSRKLTKRVHIKEHMLRHKDPNTYKCNYCTKVYDTKKSLRRHTASRHPDTQVMKYACKLCDKRSKTKGGMILHYRSLHNVQPPSELENEEEKGLTPKEIRKLRRRKYYLEVQTKEKELNRMLRGVTATCPNSTTVNSEDQRSFDEMSGNFICPDMEASDQCDRSIIPNTQVKIEDGTMLQQSQSNMELAMPSNVGTSDMGDTPLKLFHITEIDETQSVKPGLSAVVKSEIGSLWEATDSINNPYEPSPSSSLHLYNLDGSKETYLQHCDNSNNSYGTTTSSQPNPQDSNGGDYNESDNYTCNECGKISYTKPAHSYHMWYKHQEAPKHNCPQCGRRFRRTRDLMEHMASHEKRDLYACVFCPLTFRKLNSVCKHRRISHPQEKNKNFYTKINKESQNRPKRGRKAGKGR